MEKLDVVNAALAALRAGETCELVVVAGTAGSSPRGVGAGWPSLPMAARRALSAVARLNSLRWMRRASS